MLDIEEKNFKINDVDDIEINVDDSEIERARIEELELIRCAKEGDETAVNTLIEKYKKTVDYLATSFVNRNYNYNIMSCREDVAQECWIVFYESLFKYDENNGALFVTYFSTCAKNKLTKYAQKKVNRIKDMLISSEDTDLESLYNYRDVFNDASQNGNPEEKIIKRILFNTVIGIINDLPAIEKRVFLEKINRTSIAKISELVNISQYKVKNIIKKVSKHIAFELKKNGIMYDDLKEIVAA